MYIHKTNAYLNIAYYHPYLFSNNLSASLSIALYFSEFAVCVAIFSLHSLYPLNLSVSVVFALAVAVAVMICSFSLYFAQIQLNTIPVIDIAVLCILSISSLFLIFLSVVARLSSIHLFTHLSQKFNLEISLSSSV